MLKLKFPEKKVSKEDSHGQKTSLLGASLFLQGELKGEEDVVIEGYLKGKLDLPNHNLTVEKGGKVEADIHVKDITINGEVEGNIYASGKVFISKDGYTKGDITTPRISITDGAQFKGSVKMNGDFEIESPQKEVITSLYEQEKKHKNFYIKPEKPLK